MHPGDGDAFGPGLVGGLGGIMLADHDVTNASPAAGGAEKGNVRNEAKRRKENDEAMGDRKKGSVGGQGRGGAKTTRIPPNLRREAGMHRGSNRKFPSLSNRKFPSLSYNSAK